MVEERELWCLEWECNLVQPLWKTVGRCLKILEIPSMKLLSCVRLFATPWTAAHQAPPSVGFSRQEYWSGLPFLSPGDLPDPEIEPGSSALWADALPSEPPEIPYDPSIPLLGIYPTEINHYLKKISACSLQSYLQ